MINLVAAVTDELGGTLTTRLPANVVYTESALRTAGLHDCISGNTESADVTLCDIGFTKNITRSVRVVMETLTLFITEIADRSLHPRLRSIREETVSYGESHGYFARCYSTFPQHLFEKG